MRKQAFRWWAALACGLVGASHGDARAAPPLASNTNVIPFNSCIGHGSFNPRDPATYDPSHGCPETCDNLDHFDFSPGGKRTAVVPKGYAVVDDMTTEQRQEMLDWRSPPGSPAIDPGSFNNPAAHNIGASEGRLVSGLRQAAMAKAPLDNALPQAAACFALGNPAANRMGNAFADLAVTGRAAFRVFRDAHPTAAYCSAMPHTFSSCPGVPPSSGATPTAARLVAGCRTALTRAYRVARFLRAGQRPSTERRSLGWIAVSGEDDAPHRPVNVPSSPWPQYDVTVSVQTPLVNWPNTTSTAKLAVNSRYTIAQSHNVPLAVPPVSGYALAPEIVPSVTPDSDVLLFIHGMDSRAEEANDITQSLFQVLHDRGVARNVVVISVDLPTSGYADNIHPNSVSPIEAIGRGKWFILPVPLPVPAELTGILWGIPGLQFAVPPGVPLIVPAGTPFPDFQATGRTPLLDFVEQFIVNFADRLEEQHVILKKQIRAVMGGSLGGNMTFRLGRRPNLPWLSNVIVWSPASIWESLGAGDGPANLLKHIGPRSAQEGAVKPYSDGDRQSFFGSWDKPILPIVIPQAQSGTWQSDYYLCKYSGVSGARLDRHETYDANFLRWHWRLGGEQLLYSHQATVTQANASPTDPFTGRPRYLSNTKRMLLACGWEDHVAFNDICPATQATAPHMVNTPGKAIFLQVTGHSVDNERRTYFARQIAEFLGYVPPTRLGDPCTDNSDCPSGRCDSAPGNPRACIPNDGHGNPGDYCTHPNQCNSATSVTCANHVCVAPAPPGQLRLGQPCGTNQSCASGRCDAANGNPHACIPNDGWGNPGDYCTHDNQCRSGHRCNRASGNIAGVCN